MIKQRGFSLIELMIAVAIVGVIAAIAYPSYMEQMNKTRRADCAGALVNLAGAMERYYTVQGTYVGATAATVPGGGATCPMDGGTATYNLSVTGATVSAFVLQAAPTGVQTGDKCGTLTLNNRGTKGISGGDAGVTWDQCWR